MSNPGPFSEGWGSWPGHLLPGNVGSDRGQSHAHRHKDEEDAIPNRGVRLCVFFVVSPQASRRGRFHDPRHIPALPNPSFPCVSPGSAGLLSTRRRFACTESENDAVQCRPEFIKTGLSQVLPQFIQSKSMNPGVSLHKPIDYRFPRDKGLDR